MDCIIYHIFIIPKLEKLFELLFSFLNLFKALVFIFINEFQISKFFRQNSLYFELKL